MGSEFQQAAKAGDVQLIKQFIQAEIDVNQQCPEDGTTALYWAVCTNQARVCKLLLDHGADVNSICNRWGSRPLHAAADRGHVTIAIMLLQSGADVNLLSLGRRETALHKAAYRGHYEMCRILLERRTDVNVVNSDGNTALQEAQKSQHYDVYRLIHSYQKDAIKRNKPSTEWLTNDGKPCKELATFSVPLDELIHGSASSNGMSEKKTIRADDGALPCSPEKLPKQTNDSTATKASRDFYRSQFLENTARKLAQNLSKCRSELAEEREENRKLREQLNALPPLVNEQKHAFSGMKIADQTLDQGDPFYSTLARIFAETRSGLLDALSSAAVRQLSEQSTETPSHLDELWKVWSLAKDYQVDRDSLVYRKIPQRDCILSRYSLVITRLDRQYSFEIYAFSAVSKSRKRRFSRILNIPLHMNVFLPLHAFELHRNDYLLVNLPKLIQPAYVAGLVYPIQTTSLDHFVGGITRRRSGAKRGAGVPERFFLQLLYGLLSGLAHLHRSSVPHEPLTLHSVYLDRDLRPIITGVDPGYDSDLIMEIFANSVTNKPPEIQSLQKTWHLISDDEKDESLQRLTEKADVYVSAHIICEIINASGLMSSDSSRSGLMINVSEGLQHLLLDMLHPNPEHRLTAEIGKLRVGILLFGPDPNVQSKNEFMIWHEVSLIKLLHDVPSNRSSRIFSIADFTRTIDSSLRYNDVILRKDFMTTYTMERQWLAYKTLILHNN